MISILKTVFILTFLFANVSIGSNDGTSITGKGLFSFSLQNCFLWIGSFIKVVSLS